MVVIYADNENLVKIWIAFMKLALANPDRDTLKELLDLYVYKYKVFHRGRFSRNTTNKNIVHAIDTDTLIQHGIMLQTLLTKKKHYLKQITVLNFLLKFY